MRKKSKLVCGVGTNDADYPVYIYEDNRVIWCCPFYQRWKSMLSRCYSKLFRVERPTYTQCSVCEEWLTFSNFKSWMITQDWEGKELDKDLLYRGNKVYNPETCIFVDQKVNTFLTERNAKRGKWPIGVDYATKKKKFRATCQCAVTNKKIFLGYFSNPEDAHLAWLKCKCDQANILANEQTDQRIIKALIERYKT